MVTDGLGRVGTLHDVITDFEDPVRPAGGPPEAPAAFLWPKSGGVEWLVSPDSVQRVEKAPLRPLSP